MALWRGGAQIKDTRVELFPKEIACPYCEAPGINSNLINDQLRGVEWGKFLLECACRNKYFVTKYADKSIALVYEDGDPMPGTYTINKGIGRYKTIKARKDEALKAEAELKAREANLLDLKAKLTAEREAMTKAEAEFDSKVAASLARIGKLKKGVLSW